MLNQANSTNSRVRPKPLPLIEVWDRVDPLAADLHIDPAQTSLAGLPYFKLGGPGFERLVYELLQAENLKPWFFGRTGQAQYGVDIVAETTGQQTIYQCKNYAEVPSWPLVRDAVGKFESEWLNDMNLPTPREFVYCCPQPLDDKSFLLEWEVFKVAFQKRTGLVLSFLDRHALDSRLRRLPDVVASSFSDSTAELFCGRDGWRDDPWIRLQRGQARVLSINRFLHRHDNNLIYVADGPEKLFLQALDQNSTVAVRGLPGTGKTFLAFELGCRMRQPTRRIYYATCRDRASAERLWQTARRRLSLPSLFILDECHLDHEAPATLLDRLGPELRSGQLKLVLILRDQTLAEADASDDSPEWLESLNTDKAVLDLKADAGHTFAVTLHLRPDFKGLSPAGGNRLHNACGGDLLLLDEILQSLRALNEIDDLDLDEVLPRVRAHYFGGNRQLPTLVRLAALAQFDLLPLADFFDGQWKPEELAAADPLMTRLFAPPRYRFLHSSLATLVLRSLVQLDVSNDALEEKVAAITVGVLRNYLLHPSVVLGGSDEFLNVLQRCLRSRLHLLDHMSEASIKSALLGNEEIKAAIERNLVRLSFSDIGLCVQLLSVAESPAKTHYIALVERRFQILFEQVKNNGDTIGMHTISAGLNVLRRQAPDRCDALINEYGPESFLRLIFANGTLFELFKILKNTTISFRTTLIRNLTPAQAAPLIDNTIASGRSIGTLHFAMRELGKADPELLVCLEQVIGAPNFLRLILANGTLSDLFRILQYSTTGFRSALMGQLIPEEAAALIDKTIKVGRSVGTLHFVMRELGEAAPELLVRLEQTIGAQGFLRLILGNGTLFELFSVLKYATTGLRIALLELVTTMQAMVLLDKTIDAGRSISTLRLAMRDLGEADPELLVRLEQTIGAPGFLRLLHANGNIFDLFRILEYATTGFRTTLLEQLEPIKAAILLQKFVAGEAQGIESLHFLVRSFAVDSVQPSRLEALLGARGWWRLLITAGSLNSVSLITQAMTNDFRAQMMEASIELSESDWRGIIGRGLFLNACTFVTNDLANYPTVARSVFRAALNEAAPALAARASWFDLNPSRPPADPEFGEGAILRAALLNRLQAVKITELLGLDFREAVNALACCWRERSDLRPELGKHLREILSPRENWPREKGEVGALRLVLAFARSAEFPELQAQWLLTEIQAFLNSEICAAIHTLPLFLLIWNMAALAYERGPERNFGVTLAHEQQELLLAILAERISPRGPNPEKLSQLALGGLLAFLFPNNKRRLVNLLTPLKGATRWLSELAMDQGFLLATFALEGIALNVVHERVFTRAVCEELLRKFEQYEEVGPAMESMRLRVSPSMKKSSNFGR